MSDSKTDWRSPDYVPALVKRHPPGCPDADWCCGNGVCYWRCKDDGNEDLQWCDQKDESHE